MIVFFSEIEQGAGNNGIVGDEPTIEVGKAKEGSYILDFGGSWLCSNAVEFDGSMASWLDFMIILRYSTSETSN